MAAECRGSMFTECSRPHLGRRYPYYLLAVTLLVVLAPSLSAQQTYSPGLPSGAAGGALPGLGAAAGRGGGFGAAPGLGGGLGGATPGLGPTLGGASQFPSAAAGTPTVAGGRRAKTRGWSITPYLTAGEIFSDNITLAAPGNERADFVTELVPGVSIRGVGPRLSLAFDYAAQGIAYARGTRSPTINHHLQALSTAELIRQLLFLDVRGSVSQVLISGGGPISSNSIAVTSNQTSVATYSVSPYVRHHFGDFADGLVRYTLDGVHYSRGTGQSSGSTVTRAGGLGVNTAATDNIANAVDTQLRSGSRFRRLPWAVSAHTQTVHYTDAPNSTFRRFQGNLRYRITRIWGLTFTGGYENDSFQTTRTSPTGFFWQAGGTWTPSPRTSLAAGYGERFFGSTYFLQFRHQSRRTVWTASYNEDVTTVRQILLQRQVIPLTDAFGNPILVPGTNTVLAVAVNTPTLTNQAVVNKSFQGSMAIRGVRTKASVSAYVDQRDYQLTNTTESVFGFHAEGTRRLSPRISGRIIGGWQRTLPQQGGSREYWTGGVSLTRQFNPYVSGTLDYRYTQQDSNTTSNHYRENQISAFVRVNF